MTEKDDQIGLCKMTEFFCRNMENDRICEDSVEFDRN